jgi:hypothetical protein
MLEKWNVGCKAKNFFDCQSWTHSIYSKKLTLSANPIISILHYSIIIEQLLLAKPLNYDLAQGTWF